MPRAARFTGEPAKLLLLKVRIGAEARRLTCGHTRRAVHDLPALKHANVTRFAVHAQFAAPPPAQFSRRELDELVGDVCVCDLLGTGRLWVELKGRLRQKDYDLRGGRIRLRD